MIAVKWPGDDALWDADYVGRMDICVATHVRSRSLHLVSDQIIVWIGRLALRWRTLEARRMIEIEGVWQEFAKGERRVLRFRTLA